jgi:hypothetical protein
MAVDIDSISQSIIITGGKHVSNEIGVEIKRPISEVYKWVVYAPLEIQLHGTNKIPGVSSTKQLNDKKLGENGHRRLVCLNDGNTAVEEHTFVEEVNDNTSKRYFSYKVWNYTLKIAQNIKYGRGEWWFTPEGDLTRIRWRYSFKLNEQKILGKLGALGRALLQIFYLKTRYNHFMVETLKKLKNDLEKKTK